MPESRAPRPRIVILDGYTNNPGDLAWRGFADLGDLTVHDQTPPGEVVERCRGAAIICTNKTPLHPPTLNQLPALRYIGVLATGVNVVDIDWAREHGVAVTNVPGYGTDSVAQHALGLLLACASRINELDNTVRSGEWHRRGVFSYWNEPPIELAGKTLGLIGLGAIGRRVAEVAQALGMQVIAHTPSGRSASGVEWVPMAELAARADAISLHCPLTDSNAGLINDDFIAAMKPGALLINTARGGLLDEQAVARALHSGRLGGAGLDVLSTEPPAADNPMLAAPHCIITPHSAWASREARQRLLDIAAGNIADFLSGGNANRVEAG